MILSIKKTVKELIASGIECIYVKDFSYESGNSVDFDSIDEDQFDLIKDRTSIKKLNPIKDDTDTFDAVKMLNDYSKITILGGIQGKRIEHFMLGRI